MLRRRRLIPVLVVAVTLGAAVTASASFNTTDRLTVGEVASRLEPPRPALLVSDSAWLGIKTYGAIDAVQGFDHMLDLASCRRRVVGSCRNYDGHVPITLYEEVDWRRDSYHTLIVATGYNDSDVNFRSDLERIMDLTRRNGYRRVIWLTLRADVSYQSPDDYGFAQVFRNNNAALREIAASGNYPELVVADWAEYARDRPDWFASDGIHLRGEGPWAAADYVSRKVAFLDGRPCPQPLAPAQAIPDLCPDPDTVDSHAVDLPGLYPVGQRNPTSGFFMEWQGHGAWPNPPWWAA